MMARPFEPESALASQATISSPVTEKKPADVESAPATGSNDKSDKNAGAVTISAASNKKEKDMSEAERQEYYSELVIDGEKKYHKLGWVQLVVVLIVEAIALGSLSLPA